MSVFACIGWGSLLWDPRSLPMASPFRSDGPRLPIEFSRVALDGRVTLVIDDEAAEMSTWWCPLSVDSMAQAVAALGRRERIAPDRWPEWVGRQDRNLRGVGRDSRSEGGLASSLTRGVIARWLDERSVDGVVWTALPARTPQGDHAWPTTHALLAHLRGLAGPDRDRAEEYIRRAPLTIDSERRRRFTAEFGWTPSTVPPNEATPGRE